MNPYASQGRHGTQQPAPQYDQQLPARRGPAQPHRPQQVPAQQMLARHIPTRQFPAQQPPAQQPPARQFTAQQPPARQFTAQQSPARQFTAQQVPARSGPAPRFPVRQAPVQFSPPRFVEPVRPAARTPHPALIAAFGVLVAALVITTVMLVHGTSQPPPVQTAGTVPTPPVVLTTSEHSKAPTTDGPTTSAPTTDVPPTTSKPTTTKPTTTKPTTSKPTTTKPPVTKPTTTKPPVTGRAVVVREATAAAEAWARAVSSGDAKGVEARSCRQDLEVYSSGELTNPGQLDGRYEFTFQKVVQASSTQEVAIVRFGISPELGSLTKLDSYVTRQSGRWLVCLSATKLSDL